MPFTHGSTAPAKKQSAEIKDPFQSPTLDAGTHFRTTEATLFASFGNEQSKGGER